MIELNNQNIKVLFSYEEALGYCIGDVLCDKDGVCAASVVVEIINELNSSNSNKSNDNGKSKNDNNNNSNNQNRSNNSYNGILHQYYQNICAQYGNYISYNSYLICRDPVTIDKIFNRLRNNGNYLSISGRNAINDNIINNGKNSIKNNDDIDNITNTTTDHTNSNTNENTKNPIKNTIKTTRIKDVTTGYDSNTHDNVLDLPITKDCQMIMYEFDNGVTVTLRTR